MKLSRDDVAKIATLARLNFNDAELDRLATQLSSIFDYVEQLDQLDTDAIEPTTYTLTEATPFRTDEAIVSKVRDPILEQAPDREGPLFRVPKVI